MRHLRAWFFRLAGLLNKGRRDQEFTAELESHLQMHIEDNLKAGMNPEEARRQALIKLGGIEQTKERHRDRRGIPLLETLVQDLRYGLRQLRRNPGFTAVAVITLALGIGANTATFSVVDAVLLRSLSFPYRNADRLVDIYEGGLQHGFDDSISLADFEAWKAQNHVLDRMAAFEGAWFTLTDGEPQRIHGDLVSADWLPTLGVQLTLGRNFSPEEDLPGHDAAAILTNACWRLRFNADPKILGRKLALDGRSYTIVGVLPPSFAFEDREIFLPLVSGRAAVDHSESLMNYHAIALLKRGLTVKQAQAQVAGIARQLELQFPSTNRGRSVQLITLKQAAADLPPTPRRMHQTLWFMFGAVGLVMLVACANVSGLLLARGITRQKEFAVRIALGSSRGRVIRQALTETVLLFICGGVAGLILALWSRSLLVSTMAECLLGARVSFDTHVFLFSLLSSLGAGLAFGLAPALQAARVSLNDALKDSLQVLGGWRRNRVHHGLVVGEMALALVLLIGFGLLMRSFVRVESVAPGFDPTNVVTVSAGLDQIKYANPAHRVIAAQRVLSKALKLPAVKSAGITDSLPLEGADGMWFVIENQATSQGQQARLRTVAVTPGLFHTLRIPLLEGRMFTERDTAAAPPVVVINQTLARAFFPGKNPLGRRLRMEDSPSVWREIVGVVADVRQRNLDEDSAPIAYRPWDQAPSSDLSLAVRVTSSADIPGTAARLRASLRTPDRNQVWEPVITMQQLINDSESISLRRPIVRMLGAFGILGALLAAVGLYGVMSYSVSQRTREIGIRLAMGADSRTIFALVFRQTGLLAMAGIGLGIAAALVLTRLLPTGPIGWTGAAINLYGVSRTDVLTYLGFSALLALVAMLGSYIPARRATKVDPMVALRYE